MTEGEVPATIDDRVKRRDTSPLPDGAWLRFQAIARAPDPRTNHRWVLYDDGRLYLAWHSRDSEGDAPFDTDLPDEPTVVLDGATVSELRALVDAGGVASSPPFVQAPDVEGGMWRVVTVRSPDGTVHEVIYDRAGNPMLDRLQKVGSEARR
jgi:YD repeat-containing protein